MKKLMIALVAGILAVSANAASVSWGAQKGYLYDGAETPGKVTLGTAYLVLTSYAQSDLVSLFAANDGSSDATLSALQGKAGYVGSATVGSNARISEGTGTTTETSPVTAYFVVFSGDKMYISDVATSEYDNLTSEHGINFASMTTSSKRLLQAADGYSTAGWYAVPEPTSGLLMLLGMAGLALRRRRA